MEKSKLCHTKSKQSIQSHPQKQERVLCQEGAAFSWKRRGSTVPKVFISSKQWRIKELPRSSLTIRCLMLRVLASRLKSQLGGNIPASGSATRSTSKPSQNILRISKP